MTATDEAIAITRAAAAAAAVKLGQQIVAFDVSEPFGIADVFLIVSASNERQVGAVVDAIEETLVHQGRKPLRREGERDQRWVLLDYGDLVAHIQHEEERVLYHLERLWKDCPSVDLQLTAAQ